MRRLAEGAAELAAEVRLREPGRPGEVGDAQRLEVAGVGQVPGAQQMPCWRYEGDASLTDRGLGTHRAVSSKWVEEFPSAGSRPGIARAGPAAGADDRGHRVRRHRLAEDHARPRRRAEVPRLHLAPLPRYDLRARGPLDRP